MKDLLHLTDFDRGRAQRSLAPRSSEMKKHGKKYRAAIEKIEPGRKYSLDEAVKKLKEIAFAKLDDAVELTIWLGVDPRKVEDRVDKHDVIHTAVGKVSFDETKIVEHTRASIEAVVRAKPSTAKGKYMKKVNIAATMSPGVLLDEAAFAK